MLTARLSDAEIPLIIGGLQAERAEIHAQIISLEQQIQNLDSEIVTLRGTLTARANAVSQENET